MRPLKTILIITGVAPLLFLLLVIPLIGFLHASSAALGGFLLMAGLITLQWPLFRLFRRYLPVRDPE